MHREPLFWLLIHTSRHLRTLAHACLPGGVGSCVSKLAPCCSDSSLSSGSNGFSLSGSEFFVLSASGWPGSEGSLLGSLSCTDVDKLWSINKILSLASVVSNQCKEDSWATILEISTSTKYKNVFCSLQAVYLFGVWPLGCSVWSCAVALFA